MAFVFEFCVAEFGADDLLSIALLDSATGETLILKCATVAALLLFRELGSALRTRVFDESEEPWFS